MYAGIGMRKMESIFTSFTGEAFIIAWDAE